MLELFQSEIRYGKSTLPECCKILAERVGEPYGGSLERICQRMREQKRSPFGVVFAEELEECMRRLPLTAEDRQIVLQVFSGHGFPDQKMQLRAVEQGLEQLERVIGQQERENKEKCRMAVGLGAMSGLLLVIVLM